MNLSFVKLYFYSYSENKSQNIIIFTKVVTIKHPMQERHASFGDNFDQRKRLEGEIDQELGCFKCSYKADQLKKSISFQKNVQ